MTHTDSTLSPSLSSSSSRRRWLQHSAVAALATTSPLALKAWAQTPAAAATERRFAPQVGPWRTFDLTLSVNVPEAQGTTRLWLPVPAVESDYQHVVSHAWRGNANKAMLVTDPASAARMLYAEFDAAAGLPQLQVTSRVQTRSRDVDWAQIARAHEEPAVLRAALQPTDLLPLDGIVRQTALQATRGQHSDVNKVRAIYNWVVASAHREPSTRGCGTGDIKTMLESGNLGGKCADLNAIFVGLCRSVGVPARDVYGLRVARSAFGYKELGADPTKLQGAQHCRAEVYLRQHGWVAMDPADVLKVMRQETVDWIKDPTNPVAAPVNKGLFGGWEGNWVAYNTAHDVKLPHQVERVTLPFLMYPNGESGLGRFDELDPGTFRYAIEAKEVTV